MHRTARHSGADGIGIHKHIWIAGELKTSSGTNVTQGVDFHSISFYVQGEWSKCKYSIRCNGETGPLTSLV